MPLVVDAVGTLVSVFDPMPNAGASREITQVFYIAGSKNEMSNAGLLGKHFTEKETLCGILWNRTASVYPRFLLCFSGGLPPASVGP